jgi:hypothetical protein
MRIYDYIYINFYWLFMAMSKTDSLNIKKPIILLPGIIQFNLLSVFIVICDANTVLPLRAIFIGGYLLLLIIHYFLFIWKKRYIHIEQRFLYLSEKQKILGRLFVIFLWIEGFTIIPVALVIRH